MKRRRLLSIILSLCLLFGVCTGSALSAAAVENGAEEIVSFPSSEKFDQLWVGDYVMFSQGRTELDYKVELTVLSGDCVEIQQEASMGIDNCPAFFCKSAGTARVKAVLKALSGNVLNEQTYTLTVSERSADMTVSHNLPINATYKVGEEFSYATKIENAGFDAYYIGPVYSFPEDYNTSLYGMEIPVFATYWDMIAIGGAFKGGVHLGCEGVRDFRFYNSFIATSPGTVVLDPFCGSPNLDKFVFPSVGAISTITIEEPVINDDAPESVKTGDRITLSTALTNTAFENRKAAYYEDEANFAAPPVTNDDYLAYKPTVTVIEGQELVSQSDRDYSNTLSSEETLTFLKPGTVKLLVSYDQIDVYKFWPNLDENERVKLYTPTKEITIEVMEMGTTEPVTGGSDVTVNTVPGVSIEDDSAFPEDTVVTVKAEKTGKLFEQAKAALKNLFEKFHTFSIEAVRNGVKVQPNGKVEVVFNIPEEFGSNVAVYYIDDNGKVEKIKTTVDAKSRTASVELEHFSLYALVDEGTKVPKVGESMPLGWLLLAAGIGLGGAALAAFLKKKGKAEETQ